MDFDEKLLRRRLYSHIRPNESGCTLLAYLTGSFSRFDEAGWEQEIRAGHVTVNDQIRPPDHQLVTHDCVAFYPGETKEPDADLHYKTVYEDADFCVFDKPGDLCVHPTGPFFRHTLWHLAGSDYGELHFINRLDRETSGLIIAARSRETAAKMLTGESRIRKEYLALVFGKFSGSLEAEGCLVKDPASAIEKKRRFLLHEQAPDSEFCATTLRAEADVPPDMTLVRATLHTGRQHQIRATLFSLGFPLVGDKLYGPEESLYPKIRLQTLTGADYRKLRMKRQALHAAVLEFQHPVTNKIIRCESNVDFARELLTERN